MAQKKRGLGKGLGALIGENTYKPKPVDEALSTSAIAEIDIENIKTNPYQPRSAFDQQALNELAESIKELGIIQPITVKKIDNDRFQLISGERRLRAAKMAGLKKIPAYVRDINDEEVLAFALVENIQREDLNPIEIAISLQRLMDECNYTQDQLSEKTGKARSTVANYLRLLALPAEIQAGIRSAKITMGHAKALNAIENKNTQLKIFYKIITNSLSVRETEQMVKNELKPEKKRKVKRSLPEHYKKIKSELAQKLNTKIDIKLGNKGKGKLIIDFNSNEDFNKLINILSKNE